MRHSLYAFVLAVVLLTMWVSSLIAQTATPEATPLPVDNREFFTSPFVIESVTQCDGVCTVSGNSISHNMTLQDNGTKEFSHFRVDTFVNSVGMGACLYGTCNFVANPELQGVWGYRVRVKNYTSGSHVNTYHNIRWNFGYDEIIVPFRIKETPFLDLSDVDGYRDICITFRNEATDYITQAELAGIDCTWVYHGNPSEGGSVLGSPFYPADGDYQLVFETENWDHNTANVFNLDIEYELEWLAYGVPPREPLECNSMVAIESEPPLAGTPAVISTPVTTTTEVDVNLLQNPSFEVGIMAWDTNVTDTLAFNPVIAEDAPDGQYIIKLETMGTYADGLLGRQQFQGGLDVGYYYLCGMIKVPSAADRGHEIIAFGYTDNPSVPLQNFHVMEYFLAVQANGSPCDYDMWCKAEGVYYLDTPTTVGLDANGWFLFGFYNYETAGKITYYDDFVLARSDADGNLIPVDPHPPSSTVTPIIYQTITPYPTSVIIEYVDEDFEIGGGGDPFEPIDHGITCWSIGPIPIGVAVDEDGDGETDPVYEFGFELCLHEWEWLLSFLGYQISTTLAGLVASTGVVVAWIRTR